mgnify:CR=1 FL=1
MGEIRRDDGSRRPPREPREAARGHPEVPEEDRPRARPSPIGKGDTPQTTGTDAQQPEIAEGPAEGLQPGERVGHRPSPPPVKVDPPSGTAVPRDAAGEPRAVRRQQRKGGP